MLTLPLTSLLLHSRNGVSLPHEANGLGWIFRFIGNKSLLDLSADLREL